jgi:hypothetical protein
MFFDPSSVEVELNPNVFPEDEIEWMQVDAIAGSRKEMGWNGTDPFRQAVGLKPFAENTYFLGDSDGSITQNYGKEINDYVFNFIGAGDYDGQTIEGTKFRVDHDIYRTSFEINAIDGPYDVLQLLHLFGCGTDDYIIEPQVTCIDATSSASGYDSKTGKSFWYDELYISNKAPFYFPAVEINVTVQVKLKSLDLPIILSRIYLPDFQYHDVLNSLDVLTSEGQQFLKETLDRIYAKKNLSPKTAGHTQSYDFQAARINKCFKLLTGYSR